MNVIVAGGRDFTDTERMHRELIILCKAGHVDADATLVCGMARGADITAFRLWKQFGNPIIEMPADWDSWGKRAGYIRNTEMARKADVLVAFWDGESRGTGHMISTMAAMNKPVYVVRY
ncbi:GTP-binding domain [Erwinia phage vB_EamP-S6]|uniref:Gp026 n=1 Tax=Erwinia phage vB_EamP-S6 TaxID=1051675 RepID=G0YQB8_9CAUD|nr:GTP-binding domain [Erwinia phage vB_EamP-S6]AEJ81545.1 gp026 [Erwinia phage vB_EamP-S6]